MHRGLSAEEQKTGGKWGIAFCLDARAFKCWKQSGQQLDVKSARVGTIRFNLRDNRGRSLPFSHAHGRAMQQNSSPAEKLDFFLTCSVVFLLPNQVM
jgi:hypothetical protein